MIDATRRSLQVRVGGINRRARRAGAPGRISVDDLEQRLLQAGDVCPHCDTPFGSSFRDRWTCCFAIPLSRGGHNTVENCLILCRGCEMERASSLGVRALRAHPARRAIGVPSGHTARSPYARAVQAGRELLSVGAESENEDA